MKAKPTEKKVIIEWDVDKDSLLRTGYIRDVIKEAKREERERIRKELKRKMMEIAVLSQGYEGKHKKHIQQHLLKMIDEFQEVIDSVLGEKE